MITKEQAMSASLFHSTEYINADGTPVRARRSGATKTWKTRPDHFKVPVKYMLNVSFYITHENAHQWEVAE